MFQFATNGNVYDDTGLITINEATKLFEERKKEFVRELHLGTNPQMVIWINCSTDSSYGETLYNWCAEDFKLIDGELYQKV